MAHALVPTPPGASHIPGPAVPGVHSHSVVALASSCPGSALAIGLGLRVLRYSSALGNLFEMSRMGCSPLALAGARCGQAFRRRCSCRRHDLKILHFASSPSPRRLVSGSSCFALGFLSIFRLRPTGSCSAPSRRSESLSSAKSPSSSRVSPSFLLALLARRSHSDVALDAAATGLSLSPGSSHSSGNRLRGILCGLCSFR